MDALLSAVASDLIGRLVSFLIGKLQEPAGATDTAVRLQRALLRARVVVEEAEGRHITNRAMLQQLNQLRRELCRAAYALDAFRWRAVDSNRSWSTRPPSRADVLSVSVEGLEARLSDMRELVVLLAGCPRLTRQPYSAYLFMEGCMFGRQMEMEEVISFLSRPCQDLEVLPIIGPHGVGKRTLVEHVCLDERVRDRFGKIHRLGSKDLVDDLHSHDQWSSFDFTARSLTVIDIDDCDADAEESWRRFYSAVRRRAHAAGSKVIVISRTEAHSTMGTVPPLRLRALRQEELWYFFRALAFGSADPDERPELSRIAMTLCARISNSGEFAPFEGANILAASLRADLSACSWRRLLKVFSEETVLLQSSFAAEDGLDEEKAGRYYLCRPVKDAPDVPCLFYNRRALLTGSDLPKVTMLELLSGACLPPAGETRFDVLVWQSHIPPFGSFAVTCDTERARQVVAGEKRARKRRRHDQHDNDQRPDCE